MVKFWILNLMTKYASMRMQVYKYMQINVGSHTGQITPENKKSLQLIHKYCLKNIKFSNFLKNISSIVVLSSFHLFHSRNEDSWEKGDPILAPFWTFHSFWKVACRKICEIGPHHHINQPLRLKKPSLFCIVLFRLNQ